MSEAPEAPIPSFATIQKQAIALGKGAHARPTKSADIPKVFEEALALCSVVSFDIFDTLVFRQVFHPRDVFLNLEKQDAFRRHGPWKRPVFELRIQAENQARNAWFQKMQTGEVLLPEIYDAFCQIAGLAPELAAVLAAAEEEVELGLCRPNPPVQALYQRARQSGKPIIFLSDTYHRRDFLVRLLAANGCETDAGAVFASSEYRVHKQGGQLFLRVLEHLRIPANQMLHVGDHPVSDHQKPIQLGIRAILHPYRASPLEVPAYFSHGTALLQSHIRALAAGETNCRTPRRDFWWLLGHNVAGPLLTGFCLWLHRCFQSQGIERACFLMRDGEIFERIYRVLFDPARENLVVRTLPSSRRAFIFPLLESASQFALPMVLAGVGRRPVGEYLDRLRIPSADYAAEFRASGFTGAADLIDARLEGNKMIGLFNQPRVREALRMRSALEKDLLLCYLEQEGLGADCKIAVVDLGWHGTLQKALHLLFHERGWRPQLFGYYLATFPHFSQFLPSDLRFQSYLTHLGEPSRIFQTLGSFRELLEIICSSSSGSLLHFEQTGRGVAPVFQENEMTPEQLTRVAQIHEGATAFAGAFGKSARDFDFGEIPPEVAAESLLRLQANPTKVEAQKIGGLTHSDNMGSATRRFVARFRPDSHAPADLWDDYLNAYWKQGLISQPSAQAATLRTLLWLMKD